MSYQRYPLPSGGQSSHQDQYGLSRQDSERNSWRTYQPFGTQPSFNPSVASSARPSSPDVRIQPGQSLPITFRPQQGGDLNEYLNEYSRREKTRQPEERHAYFSGLQEFWSTRLNNPTPATFQAHQLDVQRGGGSRFDPPSSLSELERSGDRVPTTYEKRHKDERCIPGSVPDKAGPPEDPHCSTYSPELAANVLVRFGLDKEDLEYLLTYPEDQITSENFPQILRQIRSQKEKKSTPASMSVPEMHTRTSRISVMNRTGSGGAETSKGKVPSDPSLVIDYGHTGTYSQVGNEGLKKFGIDVGQSKSQRAGPEVAEKRKEDNVLKQRKQKIPEQQPKLPSELDQVLQQLKQKSQPPPIQQTSPMLQAGHGLLPPPFPITEPGSAFPVGPQPFSFPPGVPQPFPCFTYNHQMMIQPPPWWHTAKRTAFGQQPTPAMISDYVATMPTKFPHICSLCEVINPIMRDWFSHQNTSQHLENCKLFRIQFPGWKSQVPSLQSNAGPAAAQATYDSPTPAQPHYQNPRVGSRFRSHNSDSRSNSRSPTPQWYLLNRRKSRSRSRSRSPTSRHRSSKYRRRRRSRSRSRSASSQRDHSSTSSYRSRSKSRERRSLSRKSNEKRSSQRKSREAQPDLQSVTERLTKKLMKTSEAQGFSSAGMEDMVKTLTPVIVAELAKMKPAASPSHNDQDSEDKRPSGTTVTLRGVSSFITHKDLLDALEIVGKTKSLVMYRSKNQAEVHFENDDDAEKVMSLKTLTVKGASIRIDEVINSKKSSKRKKSPDEQPCRAPVDATAHDAELRKTADEAQKDLTDARFLLSESTGDEDSSEESTAEEAQLEQTQNVFAEHFEKETEDPREEPESSSSAELSEQFSFTEQRSADPVTSLTVGESLEMHLKINNFRCYANKKNCFRHTFKKTVFLVSNLPEYGNGSYTEEDLAAYLCPYGFQHMSDSIYVIPQIRMAIAKMPSVMDLKHLISLTHSEGILFKDNTLTLRAFNNTFSMSPFGFYKSLMKVMHFRVSDNGEKIVYIHDISFSQIKKLREDLRDLLHIKNFMPLMNRLYMEFETVLDADLLGICLSSQTDRHSYTVYRMKPPSSPVGPLTAPEWRTPPFWLTMRTPPFLYPTVTHSFISPVCVSVNRPADIKKAAVIGSEFATVMLSGLPEHNYTHRDVARLVWPFFSTQNFQILNQNLYILSLQRRAFVFFSCWTACSKFLKEHVRTPVSLKGRALNVQVVFENIHPGSIQSNIYKSLIKWSSPLNPNPDFLDNRLLSFELSETSAGLVMMVIEVVESIAPLVNFLPLANRIYVEMVDVNSVMEVQLKISSMEKSQLPSKWKKVKEILSISSLQQRLIQLGHIPICFEPSPPQKKKMKKGQRKSHMEDGPDSPDDSIAYIANNEAPCASAVAARVLIAAEQEEAPRRTGTPGSSAIKTSPDLPEMGPGSKLTNQSQKLETRDDAPQEEKTGGGEEEEKIEGGENFPGPLTNEELKGDQRNKDLEKSDQNKFFHEFSNKCPEGDAAGAEEGEDLEPGATFRLVPEKPAANDDQESEVNHEQSQRGDEGNREETCLDSFPSKKESLQESSGDFMEQERCEPAALIRAEDQTPKETEDEVHQETMEHDGEDDQPNRASKTTEEKEELASRIPSSEAEGRAATDVETPTGGNVPADDTKKPPNIEAVPEETWTETPERHSFGDDQPTAAKKPKRGRPKKSVPAATQSSMKTQEASGKTNEEHKAPDGVTARLTHGSTAEKTLLPEEQAAEEAAVEGKEEEDAKRARDKSDFTQPEVRSAAGEDEDQKTSTKEKHSDNAEEAVNMEEETEDVTPRLRGRPRKSRKAPVRRSARGKHSADETEEVGKESLSAALQSQSDRTDGQTQGGHKQEEHNRTEAEGGREPNGSEARQSRSEPLSQSPNSSCRLLTPSVPSVRSSRRRSRLISVVSAPFIAAALPTQTERHDCSQQKLYQQLQQEPATTFSHKFDGEELTCEKD